MDVEKNSSDPLDVAVNLLLEQQCHHQPQKNIVANRCHAHFPYINWEEEAVQTARGIALRKAQNP
jgi:hypothetical protein